MPPPCQPPLTRPAHAADTPARPTASGSFNAAKHPNGSPRERAQPLRELAPQWENVAVAAWSGLTVDFCRLHGAGVIIRGVRNPSDLRHEYQLAAMNEALGITTLLLPAQPGLSGVSSTLVRAGRS
jgi:pantetheine-phosphate adenylyltransferase